MSNIVHVPTAQQLLYGRLEDLIATNEKFLKRTIGVGKFMFFNGLQFTESEEVDVRNVWARACIEQAIATAYRRMERMTEPT